MKACLYYSNGTPDVLKVVDIEKPTAGPTEVLIKIRAASLNPLDLVLLKGAPAIMRKLLHLKKASVAQPGRPGRDVAGEVAAVGSQVTQFKPGDAVFGSCNGSCAEYAVTAESSLVLKPDNANYEQMASVPIAGLTALQALRDKAHVQPGQNVLINGASGGVGTFAVQIAKTLRAKVTAVCSAGNLDLVRTLGADHVIDYKAADFTKGSVRYDVVFDLVSTHPLSEIRRVLTQRGVCVIAGALNPRMIPARLLASFLLSRIGSRTFTFFIAKLKRDDLVTLSELIAARKVTPVIDKQYGLDRVRDAMRYLETKHARGKIVITME